MAECQPIFPLDSLRSDKFLDIRSGNWKQMLDVIELRS